MPQLKPNWSEVPPRDWGEAQAHRIATVIKSRRKSAQWLSDQTRKMGYEVSRTVIADLENGRRRHVTTAELMIFAQALRTSPIELLFPGPYENPVTVLPRVEKPELWAAQWFSGLVDSLNVEDLALDSESKLDYRNAYDKHLAPLRAAREIIKLEEQQLEMISVLNTHELGSRPTNADALRREIAWLARRIEDLRGVVDGR